MGGLALRVWVGECGMDCGEEPGEYRGVVCGEYNARFTEDLEGLGWGTGGGLWGRGSRVQIVLSKKKKNSQ